MEISIRGTTTSDAPAIAELMQAAEAVDDTGEHYSSEDVVEEMENPLIDPSTDWLVAESEGRLVGSTSLTPRAPADGEVSIMVFGVVHPEHRGQGVGSALLPPILERARAYAEERGEDLVPQVRGAALSDDHSATSLLEDHGFKPFRWSFLMESDLTHSLDGDAATAMPTGYDLQTWEGIEDAEILAAHNAAFLGHHPGFTPWDAAMWRQHVSGSRAYRPALSLVARDASGAVAAYLETAEYEAVEEVTGLREAYVAKVGTTPEHRRHGLAGILLARALESYRDEGYQRAALDVDSENPSGALGIYERAGFAVTKKFTVFKI